MRNMYSLIRIAMILSLAALASACSAAGSGSNSGAAPVVPVSKDASKEGLSLRNPVAATPESVASGKKFFDKLCADCHGGNADGVSEIAATMAADEVRPPNLTDDKWDHGSTDGEIFVNIRDGVGGPGAMKGLNGRPGVGPTEMWNVVNYIRSLKK
jgi:mono/diheme cytochrome c family protein